MIGAFTSIYNAIGSIFGSSFWFRSFLPVALFAGLHALIAAVHADRTDALNACIREADKCIGSATIAMFVLVVLAYGLAAIVPFFRGLLDGTLLPARVHDMLQAERLALARRHQAEEERILTQQSALETFVAEAGDRMAAAIADGAAAALPIQESSLQAAERDLLWLEATLFPLRPESIADTKTAVDTAVLALRHEPIVAAVPNPAGLHRRLFDRRMRVSAGLRQIWRKARSAAAPSQQERLDALQERLTVLLQQAVRESLYRYELVMERRRTGTALGNICATRLGDARRFAEEYPDRTYGIPFDYVWPRLQQFFAAEHKDAAALGIVQDRIEFATLALVLAVTIPLVWLPFLIWDAASPWLFLVIAAATPPAILFLRQMLFEGYVAFARTTAALIDRHRWSLLEQLGQPRPTSLHDEQQVWGLLRRAMEDPRVANPVFMNKGTSG